MLIISDNQEAVLRLDMELNEPIERLERRLIEANGDVAKAWTLLTDDEMEFAAREIALCMAGPGVKGLIHFLCNYFFVKTKGAGLAPLHPLWDSQMLFLDAVAQKWLKQLPVWFMIGKARQVGISTVVEGIMLYLSIFNHNWNSLLLADEPDQTEYIFEMARTGYDMLPWWMKPEKRYDVKGHHMVFDKPDAIDRLNNPGLRSQLLAESANQRSGAAYGKTIHALHASEVPKYKNFRILTEGVLPTVPESHPGTFVILEGAAQRRHDDWHRLWLVSDAGDSRIETLFLAWFRERQYTRTPEENWRPLPETLALARMVEEEHHVELEPGQLYWYEKTRLEFIAFEGDDGTFLSQYPSNSTEMFQNAGICAFSKRKLHDMLLRHGRPARWRGEIRLDEKNDRIPHLSDVRDGRLKVWEFPLQARRGNPRNGFIHDKDATFYIAGDPSLGRPGGDPACWQVILIPSSPFAPMRQVACWHGFLGPSGFARVGAALGYLYGTSEICPEVNGIGQTVISDLKNVLQYPVLYRWRREDKLKMFTDMFGWNMTMTNKQNLIGKMAEFIDEDLIVMQDAATIDEAYDFVDEGDSKYYSVSKDGHGDRMIALMIGMFCANQMRPFHERTHERDAFVRDLRDPSRDFINTDYAPLFEKREMFNDEEFLCL